jgi:hypothetical protein
MVGTATGSLIAATIWSLEGGAAQGVELVTVQPGCGESQLLRVATTESYALPSLASAGDGGTLLMWSVGSTPPAIMQRRFGPHLCD